MFRPLQYLAIGIFIASILVFLQIVSNSSHVSNVTNFLRAWSLKGQTLPADQDYSLLKEAFERVYIYHGKINESQLDEGMVVGRRDDGSSVGKCDSLLFSALRFTALTKLGMLQTAETAWRDIEQSQFAGHWYRHPKCRGHYTSRDMIVGLVVALSQKPEHYRIHLRSFLDFVDENQGYFSTGPAYVSYLSPAVAELMRNMARSEKMPYDSLPDSVRSSYSTIELDASLTERGFKAHLISLLAWLEFELARNFPIISFRTSIKDLGSIANPFTIEPLHHQRLEYVTQRLIEVDPNNLFFRYLRYRAADALNQKIRRDLLAELLAMREFPRNRLPQDCDRKADYLWQRDSRTYKTKRPECHVTYSGVDFLWMASLLLEDTEGPAQTSIRQTP